MDKIEEIAGKLSEDARDAARTATLMISKKYRVHYKYAGPVMREMWAAGLMAQDSSYLLPFGLQLKAYLERSGR